MKKYVLPFILVFFIFASCSRTPVPNSTVETVPEKNCLSDYLVGMWKSDALVVGIDTMYNSNLSVVLEINHDQWTEKLKLQPIQTIFNSNKTYVSAYTTTDGKLIRVTAGRWEVGKNQLNIHQLFPCDKKMNYRIDLTAGAAELRTTLDFDGDGNDDDMYFCQMIKVG